MTTEDDKLAYEKMFLADEVRGFAADLVRIQGHKAERERRIAEIDAALTKPAPADKKAKP